jgi:alanine racemase
VSGSVVARIGVAALQNNFEQVRRAAPGCRILAVIKANAYGHGLLEIAGMLASADALAVSRIEEGIRLREAHIRQPIVVLSGCTDRHGLELAVRHQLQLVVHSDLQVALIEALPRSAIRDGSRLSIWLKIDSGMGRLGISPATTQAIVERLRACRSVADDLRLMTHLACADDLGDTTTIDQLRCFADAVADWNGDISVANSAGILGWPQTTRRGAELRYTGDNWVRPGLMLYGVTPFADKSPADLGLQPVMSFEAPLISIRSLKQGSRVGYGGDWVAPRDSVIGVVAAGYADGYPWRLGGGTPVSVNGERAEIVGRISMDLISIDLTGLSSVKAGDRVVLWSAELDVADLARRAGTSVYEILTGVGERVRRQID